MDKEDRIVGGGMVFRSITKGGALGESLSKQGVASILSGLMKKARVAKTPHGFRPGWIQHVISKGCQPRDIIAMTGHSKVAGLLPYLEAYGNKSADPSRQ